jgi:hypothetical protein
MAAKSDELGLVWLTRGGQVILNFARIRPNLSFSYLSSSLISSGGPELSLAATASGYILAESVPAREGVANDSHIRLTTYSERSSSTRDAGIGHSAILTERPDGGPLLVFRRSGVGTSGLESWAQLLSADGIALAPPARLYDDVEALPSRGTFVGDGFLVGESGPDGPVIVRVDLDGRASIAAKLPPEMAGRGGRSFMSWNGQEARVIYLVTGSSGPDSGSDSVPRVWWQRLGRDGLPLAGPVRMPDAGNEQANCNYAIASFDDDTVVLRRHESLGSDFSELLRLDVAGALAMPPVRLNVGPPTYCDAHMARLGNDVIVAWPRAPRSRVEVALARVTPY